MLIIIIIINKKYLRLATLLLDIILQGQRLSFYGIKTIYPRYYIFYGLQEQLVI